MAKAKPAGKSTKKQVSTLDKNDPRVRAVAFELVDDALKKHEAQSAERREKEAAEQATKLKAEREAVEKKRATKRKSHKSIVSRLGRIEEPLRAIHDIAELAFAADDHEAALVVASNLSMLCLKRLEDCLEDFGDYKRGNGDAWLAGESW
jgi:predicted  nucleic acid-binding Zn-ribbon protein